MNEPAKNLDLQSFYTIVSHCHELYGHVEPLTHWRANEDTGGIIVTLNAMKLHAQSLLAQIEADLADLDVTPQ